MSAVGWWLAADAPSVWPAPGHSAETLARTARGRLVRLLEIAGDTPFYRTRLREAGIDPRNPRLTATPYETLAALPIVTKAELRAAGEDVLRGGAVRREWRWTQSSGSSGEPFRVYYDPRGWATLKYLVKLRARQACGVRPWTRVALLDAIPPATARAGDGPLRRYARISVLQPAPA
ncbi:MAG: hypothetical protein M3Q93_02415, partial [Gemmatimonadota bacterium]|nr:hypothetical protein [Gemmatimonadota bacterium]